MQKLMLKAKRVLTSNIRLKLMAAVFAVILWMVVVNVDDPTQTRVFSAPVIVINEEVLTEAGRYYTIPDGNNMVQFRVTARRSILEKLSSADFTATADMKLLEGDARIPVTITVNSQNSNVTVSAKKLYLNVIVGDDMVMKHEIQVVPQGDLAEGCVVSAASANPQMVTVTGPGDVVSQVQQVVAYVDVSGASEDFTVEEAVLHFLDEAGNEIDRSRITVERDVAEILVSVLRVKQVEINVNTSGDLDDGLHLEGVSINPNTISVMGQSALLNDITVITIPGTVVNLSEIHDSLTTTVDLNAYLPEGVRIASGENSQAEISVVISRDDTQTYQIAKENIAIKNLAEGLEASIDTKSIKVDITGAKDALEKLSPESITGSVDANGLSEGEHTLKLDLDLGEEYQITPVTIKISIKETESE